MTYDYNATANRPKAPATTQQQGYPRGGHENCSVMNNWMNFSINGGGLPPVIQSQAQMLQAFQFMMSMVMQLLGGGGLNGLMSPGTQGFLNGLDGTTGTSGNTSFPPGAKPNPQGQSPYGAAFGPGGQGQNPTSYGFGPSGQGSNPYGAGTSPNAQAPNPYGAGYNPNAQAPVYSDPFSFSPGSYGNPQSPFPGARTGSPYTPDLSSQTVVRGMNTERALSVIYNAFNDIKPAGQQNLLHADLEKAATSAADPEVRQAARFLLQNPNLLRALDTGRQDNAGVAGRVDGEYDRGDFIVAMDRQSLTGSDRAALQTVRNNASELFGGKSLVSRQELNTIADTGKLPSGKSASSDLVNAARYLGQNPDLFDRLDSAGPVYGGSAIAKRDGTFSTKDLDFLLGDPLAISGSNGHRPPDYASNHPNPNPNGNPTGQPLPEREAIGTLIQKWPSLAADGGLSKQDIDTLLADPKLDAKTKDALRFAKESFDRYDGIASGKDGNITLVDLTRAHADGKTNETETKQMSVVAQHWNAVVGPGQPFEPAKIDLYIEKARGNPNKAVLDAFTFMKNNPALMTALDEVSVGGSRGTQDGKIGLDQFNEVLVRAGLPRTDGNGGTTAAGNPPATNAPAMSPQKAVALVYNRFDTLFPEGDNVTLAKVSDLLAKGNLTAEERQALTLIKDTPNLFASIETSFNGKKGDGSARRKDFSHYLSDHKPDAELQPHLWWLEKNWYTVVGEHNHGFATNRVDDYIKKAQNAGMPETVKALEFLKSNPVYLQALDVAKQTGYDGDGWVNRDQVQHWLAQTTV